MKNRKWMVRIGCLLVLLVLAVAVRWQQETEESTSTWQQEPEESTSTWQQEVQSAYVFRTQEQLSDHFERHGKEMGYDSEEAYLEGANHVVLSPDTLHKLEEEDGDDVYYLEETNDFVVVSPQGYLRTYFRPEDGIKYYRRQ